MNLFLESLAGIMIASLVIIGLRLSRFVAFVTSSVRQSGMLTECCRHRRRDDCLWALNEETAAEEGQDVRHRQIGRGIGRRWNQACRWR